MKKVRFSKKTKVYFLETIDGELVSFQSTQPIDIATGNPEELQVILVTDNNISFRIGTDQAKGLLKQLQNSIAVCEQYNV